MTNKYRLDEILSFEAQEEVVREFCLLFIDDAEEPEVRQACKTILKFCSVPGEDYDGVLGPD